MIYSQKRTQTDAAHSPTRRKSVFIGDIRSKKPSCLDFLTSVDRVEDSKNKGEQKAPHTSHN